MDNIYTRPTRKMSPIFFTAESKIAKVNLRGGWFNNFEAQNGDEKKKDITSP